MIDELVEAELGRQGRAPAAEVPPERLVRRWYLDLVGRIPTAPEARTALDDQAPGHQARLVDRLLASEGHVDHDFAFWADLLRVESRLGGGRYPGQAYGEWVKDTIRTDQPYGEMVRTLVLSEGPAMAPGNGATGFWLRDAGMPLDQMANTARAFLGTRVGCAQCHDHPFDRWKRHEFYAMAAFTNDLQVKRDLPGAGPVMKRLKDGPPEVRNAARAIADVIGLVVHQPRKVTIPVPADWQYDDAKAGKAIAAHVLFGVTPTQKKKNDDPRTALADWITAPENPRFRLVLANRLWKRWFGQGLIEPVDNLTDGSASAAPELSRYLARLLWSLDDDVRAFERILALSRTYRRGTVAPEPAGDVPALPAGPVQRRLTAEQLWDSLLSLAVDDPDLATGESADGLHRFYTEHHGKSPEEVEDLAKHLAGLRSQLKALQQEADDLRPKAKAGDGAARQRLKALAEERDGLLDQVEPARFLAKKADPRLNNALVRAAALPQPAPPGHFLRVFGESDRELIDNASRGASVPQALFLLNGVVDQQVLRDGTPLMRALAASNGEKPAGAGAKPPANRDDPRIGVLWTWILGRDPTAGERVLALAELARADQAKDRHSGLRDLAWALINSAEFREMP